MNAHSRNQLAERIHWSDAGRYLLSHGWQEATSRRHDVGIYRRPTADHPVEVLVPRDRDLADYADAMVRVAELVAQAEQRTPDAVLADLSKLRPYKAGERDSFVGRVVELHGEDNAAGLLEGVVVLQVRVGDERVYARCALGPEDYARAVGAHAQRKYISLHGVLDRRPEACLIDDVAEVKTVE